MRFLFEILNYKKIKHIKTQFSSGYLYFVSGSNEEGKTSFIKAIATLLTAQNKNVNPITFGEEKCEIDAVFLSAKDEEFSVKFMIDQKSEKFMMVKPDGKASVSVMEIREMFKFNPFSVDDWFGWGLTAEGRKKQSDIIKSLFPEDVLKEITVIESKINSKNGILYTERTGLNRDKKTSDAKLPAYSLKITETENINIYENTIKEIEEKKSELEKITDPKKTAEIQQLSFDMGTIKNIAQQTKNLSEERIKSKLESIEDYNSKIRRLETEIKEEEEKLKTALANSKTQYEEKKNKRDELSASIPPNATIKADELQQEITSLEVKIEEIPYIELVAKKKNYETELNNNKILTDKVNNINVEIDTLTARKSELFSTTELPLENIAIVDDECMFIDKDGNTLPYTEEHVSYSQGGVPIAKLLMHVNKQTKIVLLGKASEYGPEALEKLAAIAEEYDGIIIADQVTPEKNVPLEIKVFETL